jgi:hypothetical protein
MLRAWEFLVRFASETKSAAQRPAYPGGDVMLSFAISLDSPLWFARFSGGYCYLLSVIFDSPLPAFGQKRPTLEGSAKAM